MSTASPNHPAHKVYVEYLDGGNLYLEDVLAVEVRDNILYIFQPGHTWGFPLAAVKYWRVG